MANNYDYSLFEAIGNEVLVFGRLLKTASTLLLKCLLNVVKALTSSFNRRPLAEPPPPLQKPAKRAIRSSAPLKTTEEVYWQDLISEKNNNRQIINTDTYTIEDFIAEWKKRTNVNKK